MEIKLKGTAVDLPVEDVEEVVIQYLRSLVSPGEYLRDKSTGVFLAHQTPGVPGPGLTGEKIVRLATMLDVAVFTVLDSLEKK